MSPTCPSRDLPTKALEDFTARLLIHTAADDEFYEARVRQVRGTAGETLTATLQQRDGTAGNHGSIRKQLHMLASNLTTLGAKEENIAQIKAGMDSLGGQDQRLDKRIRDLDRDIQVLNTQQIDKKQLGGIFQKFPELYSEAPLDAKRRLLNVVIEGIRCPVRRGEKTGEILYKLRGDRTVLKKWEEAKKRGVE